MNVNVGVVDRVLRAFIGLALIAFALQWIFPATGWNWVGWIVGVVLLLTAIFGFCPAYALFGLSTCPHRTHNAASK